MESSFQSDTSIDLIQFREQLCEGFSEEDLRDLSFDLRVDFERLEGKNKSAKALMSGHIC